MKILTSIRRTLFGLLAFATLAAISAGNARADVTYLVNVDTSSIANTDGSFYIQFSPGNLNNYLDATATVNNFSLGTDGNGSFTLGTASTSGTDADSNPTVNGSLPPGPLTIENTDTGGVNSYLSGVTFGNTLSFNVTFSGDALDPTLYTDPSTSGSDFSLALVDSNDTPLLVDPNRSPVIADFSIGQSAVITTTTNPDPNSQTGASDATITLNPTSAAPEPSGIAMIALAIGGLGLALAKRRLA